MLLVEIVLALASRAACKVDGVNGAMVVAGEAGGTQSIVLPLGRITGAAVDIAHGTHLLAFAATDAGCGINGKLAIGNPMLEEKTAQHNTVSAGPSALVDVLLATRATHNARNHSCQPLARIGNLALGSLGGINLVDKGEIVGFGHDDRIDAVEVDANLLQIITKVIKRQPHIIATGSKGIAELPVVAIQVQTLDKIPDDEWRPPTMNRETEADALISRQLVVIFLLNYCQCDRHQAFACFFGQTGSDKARVTCTSEIEYHDQNRVSCL